METRIDLDRREGAGAAQKRAAQEAGDGIEARSFWEAADLSDACAKFSPYPREHFVISFDSFDDYAAWRNEQANPWNR